MVIGWLVYYVYITHSHTSHTEYICLSAYPVIIMCVELARTEKLEKKNGHEEREEESLGRLR